MHILIAEDSHVTRIRGNDLRCNSNISHIAKGGARLDLLEKINKSIRGGDIPAAVIAVVFQGGNDMADSFFGY